MLFRPVDLTSSYEAFYRTSRKEGRSAIEREGEGRALFYQIGDLEQDGGGDEIWFRC